MLLYSDFDDEPSIITFIITVMIIANSIIVKTSPLYVSRIPPMIANTASSIKHSITDTRYLVAYVFTISIGVPKMLSKSLTFNTTNPLKRIGNHQLVQYRLCRNL